MSRTVYVNGDYLPEQEAKISVFDRGFLFADAVYEVTSVLSGKLVDFAAHMKRLERSLSELKMATPASDAELLAIHRELVKRNGIDEGMVYMQVTRGAADRDFLFPPEETKPSLVLFTQAMGLRDKPAARTGIKIASVPDLRWARRDIKTVQLLYPSIAKTEAKAKGADDAWLVEDGMVTEGTSNNAYILTEDGALVTRALSHAILHGITRAAVLRMAEEDGLRIEERSFTLEEAKRAKEAFITSASAFVLPVVEIDGVTLGDGAPGPVARRLREIYLAEADRTAI
ncbi:D-amino-acid transaminase [Aurantimonas sp. C2-6-R+9]|uniref:D-amino-acid transaminase n=1 Tax=unclassified Aurantimonas TaxID=2638230 RepID=UPI002E19F4E0|nr:MULTISPECIES: D-amino-acid transaminase [unclassified Aurantimonas]MEC5291315.1 D-amino-acid transaminase [Aurantimonas sp. C2-3-R2]MEC5381521.1 D-amino-acid transaminase [Aurantimonas sp. C2-6-R+9]MEC5412402.1 D-amino-acid transaminase [Aurantimonas sp. C2-4-R8]